MHHIICDGWSQGVFVREINTCYNAYASAQTPNLPHLAHQYKDYAVWQSGWLQSEDAAKQRQFWLNLLSGELPILELPTDRPRTPMQSHGGAEYRICLDASKRDALKNLVMECNTTLFSGLLTLLNLVLYRYTGARDILVGTPVAGRNHLDLEDIVGFFVNTLPLRNEIEPEAGFSANLRRIGAAAIEAFDHQNYPFDVLVNELESHHDTSRATLFDVMLVLQNNDPARLNLPGVVLKPFLQSNETSKVDLGFTFSEDEQGLNLAIQYNTDLFDEDRVERLACHLENALDGVLSDPQQNWNHIQLLHDAERDLLLNDFSGAHQSTPEMTVDQLFASQAARQPLNLPSCSPTKPFSTATSTAVATGWPIAF